MRVLIIAHGHPALSAGGGERAAHSLFKHLKAIPEYSESCFAARAPYHLIGHSASFGSFRGQADELLINVPDVDHFTFQSTNYNILRKTILELLSHVRPDIVHVHHFVYFGLEIFKIIKSFGVPVVFTVHEYLLICNHYGQMVKTNGGLCHISSPLECHQCFPDRTPGIFFLRQEMMRHDLSYADALISPSKFLGERFAEWGFHQEAINVIENPLSPEMLEAARVYAADKGRVDRHVDETQLLNLGYFGQLNKFKGIILLFEAIKILPDDMRARVRLGVHGANLEMQETDFQNRMNRLFSDLEGIVTNFGAYDNSQAVELMRGYDRIVVPSVWWENSPVVIQEAKLAGVPLLASNIGGMLEKSSGSDDVLFLNRSPGSLSEEIARLIQSKERPRSSITSHIAMHYEAVEAHVELYKEILL